MALLELACLAIVALYLGVRARGEADRPRLFRRLGLLVAASWLCEDTAIRAYGFYEYSPAWSVFVDRVPLMIVLIWPVVIVSAWDLIRALGGGARGPRVVAATAAMVFVDAYLMEPIAVQSGLWRWLEPGLFAVPPIGVLGWAFFTAAVLLVFDALDRSGRGGWRDLFVLAAAPPLVHGALIVAWWGALRWVNGTVPPWAGVAAAWALALTLAGLALRHPAPRRVPRRDLLVRVPAAAFFFVLLALNGLDQPALVAYSLSFSVVYLVLTAKAKG